MKKLWLSVHIEYLSMAGQKTPFTFYSCTLTRARTNNSSQLLLRLCYYCFKVKTRDCAVTAGVVEFFGSWFCFDAPSYIPYVFWARIQNKIHIVNIAY